MKKDELVSAIAEKTGMDKKSTNATLDALGEVVTAALKSNDEVVLPGVGKFSTGVRPARQGRNPKTGDVIEIAEKTVVKYKVAKALGDAVDA